MLLAETYQGLIKPEANHVRDHWAGWRALWQTTIICTYPSNSLRYFDLDSDAIQQTYHACFCDGWEEILYVNVEDELAAQMGFGICFYGPIWDESMNRITRIV